MTIAGLALPFVLRKGHSPDPAGGACAMDAVNWLVHGKHGDAPECACPLISRYVIFGNDAMPRTTRQKLLGYLHRIAGSVSSEHIEPRLRVLLLGVVRVFLPRLLTLGGRSFWAEKLAALPDQVSRPQLFAILDSAHAALQCRPGVFAGAGCLRLGRALDCASALVAQSQAMFVSFGFSEAAAEVCHLTAQELIRLGRPVAPAWEDYFLVLDAVLAAGPQGEPWSADVVSAGVERFRAAAGRVAVAASAE